MPRDVYDVCGAIRLDRRLVVFEIVDLGLNPLDRCLSMFGGSLGEYSLALKVCPDLRRRVLEPSPPLSCAETISGVNEIPQGLTRSCPRRVRREAGEGQSRAQGARRASADQ